MRDFLKSGQRWLTAAWLLPLVLLALPNCALDSSGTLAGQDPPTPPPPIFQPGQSPTSAVMCDIPKVPDPATECASEAEEAVFKSMGWAAIGLAEGATTSIALDYSDSAILACNGQPKKVAFFGAFPDGSHVCLNCSTQIGAMNTYADPTAVCVAKCVDLVNQAGVIPEGGVQSYCEANARVSTNMKETCYGNACTNGGTPVMPFNDPRRAQEPVKWTDLEGSVALGSASGGLANTLTKTNGVDTPDFDSSAQSDDLITKGDAWIEFEAKETGKSHVVGVSTDAGIAGDLQIDTVAFALSLNYDEGHVYVLENGVPVQFPQLNTLWVGQYAATDRFRIEITDKHDGTASISYVKLDEECQDGQPCKKTTLAVSQGSVAYPLRVSALFRENEATLENVTMVFIQGQP